jgi:ankyrin repeat protein
MFYFSALHLIVVTGDPSSVNLLLNSGADINSRDNEGQVLHFVVEFTALFFFVLRLLFTCEFSFFSNHWPLQSNQEGKLSLNC